ncbi:hypothetical protein [Hymenobacter pini]|uniref:hypothetical protein n=1 Tax=Hymenobacter pini TaxID=2880879 RepID=UPI001CF47FCA|nr:hypothetical protein [Hymenobacter pini]MCA8830491.1 hypothetical protein [Hymenobacter pini]
MPVAAGKAPPVQPGATGRKPIGLDVTASGSIAKRDVLKMWEELPENRSGSIQPIPYGNRGSAIEHFSIRVSGAMPEIKDFLSRNNWLLRFEDSRTTRLGVSCSQLQTKDTRQPIPGRYGLYLQIHERG